MNQLTVAALCLFMGLFLVTLLDTLGAISSRKASYNYAYLAPLSFIVYLCIGYFLSKAVQAEIAILLTGIVGIYRMETGTCVEGQHTYESGGPCKNDADKQSDNDGSLFRLSWLCRL
jgi:hypothetical protein